MTTLQFDSMGYAYQLVLEIEQQLWNPLVKWFKI